jgi:hypothetical protein
MKKNIFYLYVQIVYGIIVTDFQIKCKLFSKKKFFDIIVQNMYVKKQNNERSYEKISRNFQ